MISYTLKKKSFFFFILIFISFNTMLFAQYQVTIKATVFDKITNKPLPYVNIGFIEKRKGTVSNEQGGFTLIYHEDLIGEKEVLQFSTLGYKTLKVKVSQLVKFLSNTNKFYLIPEPLALDEVFITNEKRSQMRIENINATSNLMGYWKDKEALGGEITTRIKIKNKRTKFLDLKFNIIENTSDSIKVRVNVYDYKKGYPKKNILKTNIFHIIKSKEGEETIDLSPYNIMVNDDVVIGIELVEVFGSDINFAISASKVRGTSFIRLISQDTWKRYYNIGINFSILTSFPVNKESQIVQQVREKPKRITLYYDVSKHMANRLHSKEFNLLANYLKKIKEVDVEVIKFNNTTKQPKIFNITKRNSAELINYLKNSDYEGASNYAKIAKQNNFDADAILLFTDGNTIFSELQSEINVPIFSINTLAKANHLQLQKAAFYADGYYINLSEINPKLAIELMLNEANDNTDYISNPKDNNKFTKGSIYGKITSNSKPIQAASIRIKNTYTEVQTDAEGNYSINAQKGDALVVSYIGMLRKEVLISTEKNIDIELTPDVEVLDEVYIEGKVKKEEVIDLGAGTTKKTFDAITSKVNILKAKDIGSQYRDLRSLLNGRFAGLNLPQKGMTTNNTDIPGYIIILDGIKFYNNPPYIDPQNIETLIYKSGQIIITTKTFAVSEVKKPVKSLLVEGNDYVEELPELNTTTKIDGIITSNSRPIQAATIKIKNSYIETQSDVDGKFRIDAHKGDMLVVNYLGMLEKEILVSTVNIINIELEPDGEVLDEVFLEGESKEEVLIDLGLSGKKSFDAIGTSVNVITAKDIGSQYTSLESLLRGRFAALNHTRQGSMNNNLGIIYDIDGMIFAPTPSFRMPNVDPQNIESLTVLTSLASTNKYGTIGRGGVIVIRTKTNGYNKANKEISSLLATDNDYDEKLLSLNTNQTKPTYISQLENAVSYNNALAIYKQLRTPSSIPYFINVSNYFQRWDKNYALNMLSNIAVIAKTNPKALRTLAYKFEENNKLEKARYIYERIAILRPKDAQSYRDLALIYQQTGAYKKAIELYGQMLNNQIEGVNFSGLRQPITSELQHLLAKHRSKVDFSNIHADYLRADFKYDLRIVFDWNDPNTEFEVQFVNPQKKYYKWSQTKLDNRERMIDGITKGYHTEEFIIDDNEAGEWIINIESLNDEPQLNPTYLKYTVYRNYGLANETKEIKVVNLNTFKPKVTFDKLVSN
jgi:CarboxypepD_reg-like domain